MHNMFSSMQYFLHTADKLMSCRKNICIIISSLLYWWNVLHYSAGQPYCSAKFLSLRTGDEVHNIPYTEPVTDIRANDRYDFQFSVVVEICRFLLL